MAKIFAVLACLLLPVLAEPPIGRPSSQYGAPGGSRVSQHRPSSQYGPPSSQYGPPTSQYGPPSSQYGPPTSQYSPPSSQYGPPSSQYGPPSRQYGPARDEGNYPPANYEFNYDVDAPEYGVKFGHQENRKGDLAVGSYYVLLPDGRTQLVEYEADQDGYRPKITYQGTANTGGYGRGPQGSGGYSY